MNRTVNRFKLKAKGGTSAMICPINPQKTQHRVFQSLRTEAEDIF